LESELCFSYLFFATIAVVTKFQNRWLWYERSSSKITPIKRIFCVGSWIMIFQSSKLCDISEFKTLWYERCSSPLSTRGAYPIVRVSIFDPIRFESDLIRYDLKINESGVSLIFLIRIRSGQVRVNPTRHD
jgi:hypothetical protein